MRYRLVCVADLPDKGATDDLDEAFLMADAHHEVYDTQTGQWLGPTCGCRGRSKVDPARQRPNPPQTSVKSRTEPAPGPQHGHQEAHKAVPPSRPFSGANPSRSSGAAPDTGTHEQPLRCSPSRHTVTPSPAQPSGQHGHQA